MAASGFPSTPLAHGGPLKQTGSSNPTTANGGWCRSLSEIHDRLEQTNADTLPNPGGSLLFLDEIQKVPNWSEAVKHLWDADSANSVPLKVVLLGSTPLLSEA